MDIRKLLKRESVKKEEPVAHDKGFSVSIDEPDEFAASIRAAEPILKFKETEKAPGLKQDLLPNIAGTVMIAAVLAMFCMAQEAYMLIPFMMPGAVLFFALTLVEALRPGRLRWIILGAVAVLLIVSLIVFRGAIAGGLASIMNSFYDFAEEAQAYIYKRFPVTESASDRFAAVWISCFLGFVMALPTAGARRVTTTLLALATMFAVAYYGMIPSYICIAVMLVALILLKSRGSILSILPLILAAMVVFGCIVLIDPAENYAISRMDENFRDRFAFHSLLIENPQPDATEDEEFDDTDEEEDMGEDDGGVFEGEYGTYAALGVVALAIALIAAAIYLLRRYLKRKQAIVRAGIDSSDPKTAVTAIFPYSVRWLRACGLELGPNREAPFSAMLPAVAREFPSDYGRRFGSMYDLWKEAAYSDHAVSDESLQDMKLFMKETVELSKGKCSFKDKLKIIFRYAL